MIIETGIKMDENGSVLVVTLIMLCLLTLIGISASSTATNEMFMANNQRSYKIAFYSAETARSYVSKTSTLYNSVHIELNQPVFFPDEDEPSEKYTISQNQKFNGNVRYTGASTVPRGSGFQAGKFKAHKYKMECVGNGPFNGEADIKSGFYRIGF